MLNQLYISSQGQLGLLYLRIRGTADRRISSHQRILEAGDVKDAIGSKPGKKPQATLLLKETG